MTAEPPAGYRQLYDDVGDDALVNTLPDGRYWWLCEHEDADPTVMEGRGRVACRDCGTVWITWTHGGRILAKAVVARIG